MLFQTSELLLLKEAADKRASNGDVLNALSGWFEARTSLSILDLRAGTGSNVRALAPVLAPDQAWTLYALSDDEIAVARDHLTRWAPAARETADGLELERQGLRLTVCFKIHDVVTEGLPTAGVPDLVVVDADCGRYPAATIRAIAAAVAAKRAALHARLVYDGRLKLSPHHAADGAMTAALHRQLMQDAAHGEAMGQLAAGELSEQLELSDYSVIEGPSPLFLKAENDVLIRAMQKRLAEAQRLVAKGHDKMIDTWLARPRQSLEISQTDLIALPPAGSRLKP